ncbi:hypothetical protein R3P38DRAFT_3260301 [Favolaschia claudopus]|uniref:Uncharacterized protein n=1 Tax=Favolaschia claudopus TaxID=2862362 RepID=A0AAW0CV63_9AGAR
MPALTSSSPPPPLPRAAAPRSLAFWRRSQQNTCNPSKRECATIARVVAQKRRIPPRDENQPSPYTSSTVLGEVDASLLVEAYPDLAGIPAEYLRDRLPLSAPSRSDTASSSVSPKELQILMNDTVAAACPTHMLAVYTNAPVAFGTKRHVSLFPHPRHRPPRALRQPPRIRALAPLYLFLARDHPRRPPPHPPPKTFSLLHGYLYTQHSPLLRRRSRPSVRSRIDLLQLATHASKIHGLWRNACALGVVDAQLYDIIEESWERTLAAMQSCSS